MVESLHSLGEVVLVASVWNVENSQDEVVLVASVWNVENSHSQDEVVLVASVWIVLERHLDVMIVGCTEHTAAGPYHRDLVRHPSVQLLWEDLQIGFCSSPQISQVTKP